jgi:tetratricopeptide (TPR) repeat protein
MAAMLACWPIFSLSDLAVNDFRGDERVCAILVSLASVRMMQGRFSDAELLLRESLKGQESVYGPEHSDLAPVLYNLAVCLHRQGSFTEAEATFNSALVLIEKTRGPEHLEYARCLASYSQLLRDTKRKKEASRLLKQAQAIAGDRLNDYGTAFTVDARALASQ